MSEKIDLKKTLKDLYQASAKAPSVVEVPTLRYLMVDGEGDPNTVPAYTEAVEALFSVSYTAKFMVKKGPQAIDYGVMPLESLWWADDPTVFRSGDRSRWKWTAMILQPDFATDALLGEAIDEVRRKKRLPGVDRLRLESLTERRCAQILHVGPFTEEGPTIERLHAFITALTALRGRHHEIYLSDIQRTEPAKWKTIIRQPMA